MIAKTISHYKLLEKLGQGGMGVVYKAQDLKLDRFVALKFLPLHLSADEDEKKRFIHEAKAASALDHPNICTIYEINETEDEQIFIAMAYYEGETLKKKVASGQLSVASVIDIAMQTAQGLARAHETGITHRDIKPANLMITTRGVVKILDFGLAKLAGQTRLTKSGTTMGTVAYMSPEQARSEEVDYRTDIWSLGVVLYEMLTGQLPFKGDYEQAVVYSILCEAPKPVTELRPEAPMALERIVNKALAKKTAERYQHIDEMLVDLRSVSRELEAKQPRATPISISSSRRHRIWRYGGVAVILLVLLLIAGHRFLATERGENIRSIAVLPMTNRSADPGQDHIVDGMTDLLINNLSRLNGLDRVISRTTMMRYKHSDKSLREIGQELDVDALIEASVLSDREQVLVTVNLIEAKTERNLWSMSYERAFRDLLRVEREMALAIAQEIKVQLAPQDQTRLVEAAELNPEALDLYLKGLQARAKDPKEREQAIAYFEQAIAIDSSFAPAYAGLAIEYALEGGFDALPGGEVKARQFAEKALSLDASLSEPYIAIGLVRELVDWDWAGAEEAFRHAIKLNPGDAFAHDELGQLWMRLSRFDEALRISKQALYLDPLSARWQHDIGAIYLYSARYDEAIVEIKKAGALNPNIGPTWSLGLAYWQTGRYEEALRLWEEFGWAELGLARYYALTGQQDNALGALEAWKARWAQGDAELIILWNIAIVYADLGEKDQALDWLERAYQARLGFLIYVKVIPFFYSLRGEPRFQALLEKMGFPK